MFEPAACGGLRVQPVPTVNCDALRALQVVLRTLARCDSSGVLQAQHRSLPAAGGADAPSVIPARLSQLTLFRPLPSGPSFQTLPPEVQAKTIRLLARLLRGHVDGVVAAGPAQEARDE